MVRDLFPASIWKAKRAATKSGAERIGHRPHPSLERHIGMIWPAMDRGRPAEWTCYVESDLPHAPNIGITSPPGQIGSAPSSAIIGASNSEP